MLSRVSCLAGVTSKASFDSPKAAVKCQPQPFPVLAVGGRHFSQSTRVWETVSLQHSVDSSQLLPVLAQALACLPCPSSSVSPTLGGTLIAPILTPAGAVSGFSVSTLSSPKAASSLVTEGAGPWERAHLSPERARHQASVQHLD